MLLRRLLLALGVLALVAGVVLAVLSLRVRPGGGNRAAATQASILVAARDLPTATLMRSEDLKWTEVAQVPPGAYVRGKAGENDALGAATRRDFKEGDPIVADGIIRPTQVGFLPAVLAPGMRAIALSIDAAAVGAGLIRPGDHVDVILTQNLESEGQGHAAALKSVGETILSNIRVIATDQITNLQQPGNKLAVAQPARVPQSVTLEVSEAQAQTLVVAHQLGRLQLSLRGLADSVAAPTSATPLPTWATQVSPALRALAGGAEPGAAGVPAGGAPVQAAPVLVEIVRGGAQTTMRIERRCFSEKTHTSITCSKAPVAPGEEGAAGTDEGAPAAAPAAPAPAAPGKQGALSLPSTARAA